MPPIKADAVLIQFEPFRVGLAGHSLTHDPEHFHRLRLSFHLDQVHCAQHKLLAHQRGNRFPQEEVQMIFLGQTFEPRGDVHRIADYG